MSFAVLLPLFYLIPRMTWPRSVFYGFLYGALSYGLFNSWLITFHPLGIFIVPGVYALAGAVLFPALKGLYRLAPSLWMFTAPLAWVGAEYLKTLGFLGYPYGILGYAHWENLFFLQSASWGGVWILSLVTAFPGAWAAQVLFPLSPELRRKRLALVSLVGYTLALGSLVISGGILLQQSNSGTSWRVALVQDDLDPWKGGLTGYRQGLDRLKSLTDQGLKTQPEAVIWAETAFVPSIEYHSRYREDPERWALVEDLTTYLGSLPVPVVLGNSHGVRKPVPGSGGEWTREDYNSAFLFAQGEFQKRYDKIRLVPFTESFPFEGGLSPIRRWLEQADTHFWIPGEEKVVFNLPEVRFSTPICFEDTFGDLNREFVLQGAQVLVNLTNDSWAGVSTNMYQHLAISVFRAVENRRSLVRAASGGITAAVDPQGRILAEAPPFTRKVLTVEVPVVLGPWTLYTLWGDWLAWVSLLGGVILGAVGRVLKLSVDIRHVVVENKKVNAGV